MENRNDAVVKTLNNLIEVNLDRTQGYETAAKNTDDAANRATYNQYAVQSMTFRNELERLVKEYGGEPVTKSSMAGTVYRAWMETKSALSSNDKKAMLNACEFGEDAAKKSYTEAKQESASHPSNVQTVVTKQYDEILKAHDTIRNLRDSLVEHPH